MHNECLAMNQNVEKKKEPNTVFQNETEQIKN